MPVKVNPASRRDPAATRQRILDAAFEAFCESGLAGARVDAVAARAGVNKRMLYHYFGSKEELFRALLSEKAGAVRDVRARRPGTLADDLAYFQADQREDARWVRLLMFEALTYGAESIANEDERSAAWQRVVDAVRAAQAAGVLAPELDAAQLQLSLVALVTFPVAFPQITRLITGHAPDEPAFLAERQRFLRALAERLSETPEG